MRLQRQHGGYDRVFEGEMFFNTGSNTLTISNEELDLLIQKSQRNTFLHQTTVNVGSGSYTTETVTLEARILTDDGKYVLLDWDFTLATVLPVDSRLSHRQLQDNMYVCSGPNKVLYVASSKWRLLAIMM